MDGSDWSKWLTVLGGLLALAGTLQQAWRSGREGYAASLTLNTDRWEILSHPDPDPAAVERQKLRDEKYKRMFGHYPDESPLQVNEAVWRHYWEAAGLPIVLIGLGSLLAIVGALVAD